MSTAELSDQRLREACWALLLGNFFIGCGVMVVAGGLNDLTRELQISISQGGHLIAVAAVMMGGGAPVLASLVSRLDRRQLLVGALFWYAIGHALSALAPDYSALLPIRALTVLGAAVFTPQAAASIGHISPSRLRARNITFIFMGWSVASVIGMPVAAWVSERFGWRVAMWLVASGAAVAALWLWRVLPSDVRTRALPMRAWKRVLRSPVMMAVVLVTACQSAGQQSVLAYSAPYFKFGFGASPEQISTMFAWFGALALTGNLLLNRFIDRIGAARAVTCTLALMAVGMSLWPQATSLPVLALVMMPWAISGFATNSGQQARLGGLSPRLAPALLALNTSGIYLGHAAGATGGSFLLQRSSYACLPYLGLAWMFVALVLSLWALVRQQRRARRRSGRTKTLVPRLPV
ncbi:MAG TPA: MFS transporter [Aquabacterium sp.]|nr:MFS transporter [Aquabacterium sp.]